MASSGLCTLNRGMFCAMRGSFGLVNHFNAHKPLPRILQCTWKTQTCLASSSSTSKPHIDGTTTHKPHVTNVKHSSSNLHTSVGGVAVPTAADNCEETQKIKKKIDKIRDGRFEEEVCHPEELTHFRKRRSEASSSEIFSQSTHDINTPLHPPESPPPLGTHTLPHPICPDKPLEDAASPKGDYMLPHPIWNDHELLEVKETHKEPERFTDKLAFLTVRTLRGSYDFVSGYNRRERTEALWINRICFLETVAGVPGMVAAMVRHLDSLRRMRRDHGWIHTLLEEAENERMHLMTALQLKQPGLMFRGLVMGAQGIFVTFFSFAYMLSPRYCHRLVGYLEEEAVKTYTKLLKDMECGTMQHWNTQPAPELAVRYWQLRSDATMKDVILAIRADEAHHRVVNHTLGSMKPDDYNPYKPGQ